MRDQIADARDTAGHHFRGDKTHPRAAQSEAHAGHDGRGGAGQQDFKENVALRSAEDARGIDQRGGDAGDAVNGVEKDGKESADKNDDEHGELNTVQQDIPFPLLDPEQRG